MGGRTRSAVSFAGCLFVASAGSNVAGVRYDFALEPFPPLCWLFDNCTQTDMMRFARGGLQADPDGQSISPPQGIGWVRLLPRVDPKGCAPTILP